MLRYVQSISHVWLQTHESADKLRIQHYGSLLERRHDVQHAYAPRRTILGDLVLAPWLVHVPNSRYVFPSPSYLFPTPFVALDLTVTCQVQASRKLSAHFRRAEECTYSFFYNQLSTPSRGHFRCPARAASECLPALNSSYRAAAPQRMISDVSEFDTLGLTPLLTVTRPPHIYVHLNIALSWDGS